MQFREFIMKNFQAFTDKTAIGLSLLCALHCLAFPVILVLLPSVAVLELDSEAFHVWMLLAVIPMSAYALTLGCKRHKHHHLLAIGLVGLACLMSAVILGESLLGETWEKTLTIIGAGIITYGHVRNFRLCQRAKYCACPEDQRKPSK